MKSKVSTIAALGITLVVAATPTTSEVISDTLTGGEIHSAAEPGHPTRPSTSTADSRSLPWPYYFSFKRGTVFRIDGPLSYNGCGRVLWNAVNENEANGRAEVLTLEANIPDTNVQGYYRFMVRRYGTWRSEVWLARRLGENGQPDWTRKYAARATRPETTTRQVEWRDRNGEFFSFRFLRKNSKSEQDVEFYYAGSYWDLDIELRDAPYPGRGHECGD